MRNGAVGPSSSTSARAACSSCGGCGRAPAAPAPPFFFSTRPPTIPQIGKGSGRGKGEISGGAGLFKKKKKKEGIIKLTIEQALLQYNISYVLEETKEENVDLIDSESVIPHGECLRLHAALDGRCSVW